jgi:hypothetical protein
MRGLGKKGPGLREGRRSAQPSPDFDPGLWKAILVADDSSVTLWYVLT